MQVSEISFLTVKRKMKCNENLLKNADFDQNFGVIFVASTKFATRAQLPTLCKKQVPSCQHQFIGDIELQR